MNAKKLATALRMAAEALEEPAAMRVVEKPDDDERKEAKEVLRKLRAGKGSV